MKHLYKVVVAAALLLIVSCTKGEKFADLAQVPAAGVFGIIEPVTSDDPETKATQATQWSRPTSPKATSTTFAASATPPTKPNL